LLYLLYWHQSYILCEAHAAHVFLELFWYVPVTYSWASLVPRTIVQPGNETNSWA